MEALEAALLLTGPTQRCYLALPEALAKEVEKKLQADGLSGINELTRLLWLLYVTDQLGLNLGKEAKRIRHT